MFSFEVNESICECAYINIRGIELTILLDESEETKLVKEIVESNGLDRYEEINNLAAIRRIAGMIVMPMAK